MTSEGRNRYDAVHKLHAIVDNSMLSIIVMIFSRKKAQEAQF